MTTFVYVVDDDDALRNSLFALLTTRADLLIRNFRSGGDFLESVDDLEPGIVLLDLHMSGMSGLDVQQALHDGDHTSFAVIIAGRADVGAAVQAMKLGADEFLEKPYAPAALFQAIDMCVEKLERDSKARERVRAARTLMTSLSARELEVLHHLMDGRSNKTVAQLLELSPRTVEVHRASLMAKLGVGSLAEAVRLAYTAGMLPDG